MTFRLEVEPGDPTTLQWKGKPVPNTAREPEPLRP